MDYTIPAGRALVLRCNAPDDTSYNGWSGWPKSGPVEAPDWQDNEECGSGLHGWLWGEGDVSASDHHARPDAIWRVVEVVEAACVDLRGKVKFPRGNVLVCGTRDEAVTFLQAHAAGRAIIYATVTGGYGATVTGGDGATVTGGDGATVTGGYGATVTGGYGATLQLSLWDFAAQRRRIKTAYVGEDGIRPGVAYKIDAGGSFVCADLERDRARETAAAETSVGH